MRRRFEVLMEFLTWIASFIPAIIAGTLISFLLFNGASVINWKFVTGFPERGGLEGGILPAIIGSVYISALCMLIAAPIGIGAGTYLAEYAPENIFTKVVRFFVELLAGIPSIVIGLFGYVFLVHGLGLGFSILSGAIALAFMILPWTIRVSEEAIRAVPREYRYASLALGASKWKTIRRVVLPVAKSGILASIILGLGNAIGETMAVLMVIGNPEVPYIPTSILDRVRVLTSTIVIEFNYAVWGSDQMRALFAIGVILFTITAVVNLVAFYILGGRIYAKKV